MVMGVLPGWWLGAEDSRPVEPYISSARWDSELRKAGFAGVHTVSYDGYLNNNIIAMPVCHDVRSKQVTVLHLDEQPGSIVEELIAQLDRAGFSTERHRLSSNKPLPPHQDVVSTLDFSGPFFHDMTEDNLVHFQRFVREAKEGQCSTLWITGASQVGCKDPRFAPTIGVARTIRTETGLEFATLELADFENGLSIVPKVLVEFQRPSQDKHIDPEGEWAVVGDEVLIARYHFISVSEELKTRGDKDGLNMVKKVEQQRAGLVSSLFWKEVLQPELGADEVRVQMKAVGLNFKVSARTCAVFLSAIESIAHGLPPHNISRFFLFWNRLPFVDERCN